MEYRQLGRSGLRVSEICLGTMQFKWTTDEATSYQVLDVFAEAGGNFLDTADIYSSWGEGLHGGEAETVIGNWMARKGNRRQIVVATKARGRMWPGPNGEGLSRAHLIQACDDSLRRLQTDYIDLYQTHWPDDDVVIEETMRALDDLVKAGKVRYVGCSNYKGWQLVEALLTSRQLGLVEYVSVQPHWSLVERVGFETDAYAVVRKYGLGIIPYSPLAAGFLTGKYKRSQPLPESKRASGVQRWLTDKNFDVLDRLGGIARGRGKTVSQIALAWLLSMPSMTAPIIGANTPDQLSESLGAVGVRLTAEEMQSLDALTAPPAEED
jgi:aryl-alcohol dehydrogenase-like predicted oxidoreductase